MKIDINFNFYTDSKGKDPDLILKRFVKFKIISKFRYYSLVGLYLFYE